MQIISFENDRNRDGLPGYLRSRFCARKRTFVAFASKLRAIEAENVSDKSVVFVNPQKIPYKYNSLRGRPSRRRESVRRSRVLRVVTIVRKLIFFIFF